MKSEIVNKIRVLLGMVEKSIKLSQISAINKWTTNVDQTEFAVGTKLTYTYENDETIYTVSSGEYELDNGDTIQVDSDGVIVLYTKKGEDATTTETTETSAELAKQIKLAVEEDVDVLKDEIALLKTEVENLKKAFEELMKEEAPTEDETKTDSEMETNLEKQEPIVEPIKNKQVEANLSNMSPTQRYLMEALNKKNKK